MNRAELKAKIWEMRVLLDSLMVSYTEAVKRSGGLGMDKATLREARVEFERAFILEKLVENCWNVSKTADVIGIQRCHLHRKIKQYGIGKEGV